MKKLWDFLNSAIFDFFGGLLICIADIFYFIGYLNITVDPKTFIFAALMVIGVDCLSHGGHRLFFRKSNVTQK